MTAERTGNQNGRDEAARERLLSDDVVRETRVNETELLLWSAGSEGAWVQSDTVVTLPDQADSIKR